MGPSRQAQERERAMAAQPKTRSAQSTRWSVLKHGAARLCHVINRFLRLTGCSSMNPRSRSQLPTVYDTSAINIVLQQLSICHRCHRLVLGLLPIMRVWYSERLVNARILLNQLTRSSGAPIPGMVEGSGYEG